MTGAGVRVGVGSRFTYDGEIIEIVEMHTVDGAAEAMARDLRADTVRRYALSELMFSERARPLADDLQPMSVESDDDVAAVKWSAAPETAKRLARSRAVHVREVLTGYRSGCAETALPGEPRAKYETTNPMQQRKAAKAQELGVGLRTVERWMAQYLQGGEAGLVSGKAIQPGRSSKTFELFEQTALEIMIEHTDKSRPSEQFVIAHGGIVNTCGLGCFRRPPFRLIRPVRLG
jgi:hypothetical protein